MRLGDILIEMGKATRSEVDQALSEQSNGGSRVRLGEMLVRQEVISESDLLDALGKQFGLDVVGAVTDEMLDAELIQDLSVDWVRSRNLLPVRHRNRIAVLTADPAGVQDQDDLALMLGEDPIPILAPPEVIRKNIEKCFPPEERNRVGFHCGYPVEWRRACGGGSRVRRLVARFRRSARNASG